MECDGVWGLGYRIAFAHVRTFMVIRDGLYKETMRTKRQIEDAVAGVNFSGDFWHPILTPKH